MKRPNSSSKVAVVTSSPFSSTASTPVHIQVTKPSLSRPTVTTTTVANTNENNDTANMVAAAAAALPAAGTVLVTQSGGGGGGLFSFSIRKFLWSVAILFIGWYLYTKRSKIMLWLMPDKKPRVIQKRPFEKEEFVSSSTDVRAVASNQVGSNETVAIDPENQIEDMRAKRLKKMNTTEVVEPQSQGVVGDGEQEKEEEEQENDEHQHSEQEKMEMLHELNMMVGDIDIFPTIPMFHPPPPHDGNGGGGGVAFVMSTSIGGGPQPPSNQDSRITEIIDEPVQNKTGSDHVQQEPIIQATATPSTGGGGGSTGFGKRSRRKQE